MFEFFVLVWMSSLRDVGIKILKNGLYFIFRKKVLNKIVFSFRYQAAEIRGKRKKKKKESIKMR